MKSRSTLHCVTVFAFLFAIILTPVLLDSVSDVLDLSVLQMVTVAMMLANLAALGVFSLVVQLFSDEYKAWEESSYRPYVDTGTRALRKEGDRPPSRARTSALLAGIDPERQEFVFE